MTNFEVVEAGTRLDLFLIEQTSDLSRGQVQKLIEQGRVLVNGVTSPKSYKVRVGDTIALSSQDLNFTELKPEDIPLDIIYEDADLLILNKPAGCLVHPDSFTDSGTLVQGVIFRYPEVAQNIYDVDSSVSRLRPGIVHRLDRDTTGALMVAKTNAALHGMADLFRKREIKKVYLGLFYGKIEAPLLVEANIRRKTGDVNKMGIGQNNTGKPAKTLFEPEQVYENYPVTLARCLIESGRTHQIRVHAKYKGHPVIGDMLYGNKTSIQVSESLGAHRQMLHAWKLEFRHPVNSVNIEVIAPAPVDFQEILDKLS